MLKYSLTVVIKRQLCPVAGNRILIRKCGFGQEVFNLSNSTAEIVSLHFHRLRLLEEQPEGDRFRNSLKLFPRMLTSTSGAVISATPSTVITRFSLTFRIAKEALFASDSHSSSLLPFTSTLKSSVLE